MPKPTSGYVPPKKKKKTSSIQNLPMGTPIGSIQNLPMGTNPIEIKRQPRKTATDGVVSPKVPTSSIQNPPLLPIKKKKKKRSPIK